MAKAQGNGFTAIGRNPKVGRVSVKVIGDDLLIRIPLKGKAAANPPLSKTGKSHLLGNTGGFTNLPGFKDVRLNVCMTHKVTGKVKAPESDDAELADALSE